MPFDHNKYNGREASPWAVIVAIGASVPVLLGFDDSFFKITLILKYTVIAVQNLFLYARFSQTKQ